MEGLFGTTWFIVVLQGGSALFALAGALVISSAIALNKGAKMNLGWGLTAAGLILIGLAEGNRLLETLGMPFLPEWDRVETAVGIFLILLGALSWRHLLKKTLS